MADWKYSLDRFIDWDNHLSITVFVLSGFAASALFWPRDVYPAFDRKPVPLSD